MAENPVKILSPRTPKIATRDLTKLQDAKILSSLVSVNDLKVKRESLYIESLYDNPISSLNYGSSVQVTGDSSSTLEVGLHIVASALEKQLWSCVVDARANSSSLALFESAGTSPRFVCMRNFDPTRIVSVLSHVVSSMRIVVCLLTSEINSQNMARLMSRIRENNSIMILLDPNGYCKASCDRKIVATTNKFSGLNQGSGILTSREMNLIEYEHGMRISSETERKQVKYA